MKSRPLSEAELTEVSEAGTMQALMANLAGTTYRRALERALVRASGREAALRALRDDLEQTLVKVRGFYGNAAGERAYDVGNLKAILRGLSSRAAPDEIRAALLPVGRLSNHLLSELAQAEGRGRRLTCSPRWACRWRLPCWPCG